MSSWAEERRATRAAEAEIQRQDANAVLERKLRAQSAAAEQRRADTTAAAKLAEQQRKARQARRAAMVASVADWLSANRVRLPIYLLALVSAGMAVPAMAGFGVGVYGNATGAPLPALSELGMWAFAFAVEVTRHRHPERPVWALQLGVWVFAGVGFALNVLHGWHRGADAAVVMGIVSVAGVIAHQLAVASPPRSAAERAAARIERKTLRKVARVRRAAVRTAVAELAADGTARLVFTPGRYTLDGRRLASVVAPDRLAADVLDEEIAAFFAEQDQAPRADDGPIVDAPILTLDRPGEQPKSTRKPRPPRAPKTRSIEDLRAAFAAAIDNPDVAINPKSAESIRKTLRCAPKYARQLRDEHKNPNQ
ncbi:hypothetical protein DMA12_47435 [Amycolatopsis balhimycina DSM 5908]|uniref:DUF2637 domain-containing protein n=1 Tax=Amycolatopsis balhimycina DSM 5908 TaxID=1081091 RepID=A0A428VUZ3_AMYBA|nr:hypothetical protein [Amycolatopsis balhimycina]RSM34655.1 hypothetical protein DMA12_47435 [Amycolatopsis balhimycina DSM 5908]